MGKGLLLGQGRGPGAGAGVRFESCPACFVFVLFCVWSCFDEGVCL